MIIERTKDVELVKAIISDPDIFSCISEDGIDEYEPCVESDCWLSVRVGDLIIGVYNLHPINSATLEIHAHILPRYRKEHSLSTGLAMYDWILKNCPDMYQKLVANVPEIYENVKKFCELNGFIVEGCNRLSHRKDGLLHNVWNLGITRDEIKRFVRKSA